MAQIISWDATLVAVVAGLVVLAGPLLTLDVVRGRQESVAVTHEALENEDILCLSRRYRCLWILKGRWPGKECRERRRRRRRRVERIRA